MIVVDTNTVAYLYLRSDYTSDAEQLLASEPHWVAPSLWRSEFRNILALYLRQNILDLETACHMQAQAEALLRRNEFEVDSVSVLALAHESGCTAYDCEFISLARSLNTKMVTSDKKLLAAFPKIAISAKNYIAGLH